MRHAVLNALDGMGCGAWPEQNGALPPDMVRQCHLAAGNEAGTSIATLSRCWVLMGSQSCWMGCFRQGGQNPVKTMLDTRAGPTLEICHEFGH